MARKLKRMASSPEQVLDHQEVRHPPKDHSHRKDRREKGRQQVADDIHALQHQELVRHPRRCYFIQRAEKDMIRIS